MNIRLALLCAALSACTASKQETSSSASRSCTDCASAACDLVHCTDADCVAFLNCLEACGSLSNTACFEQCSGGHPMWGKAFRFALCLQSRCADRCSAGSCTPQLGACSTNSDCCPGYPCEMGRCGASCRKTSEACTATDGGEGDCCPGLSCTAGYCGPPPLPACTMAGGACLLNSDCCQGSCKGDHCCLPDGMACTSTCCNGCISGTCGACLPAGSTCFAAGKACCSGNCANGSCN